MGEPRAPIEDVVDGEDADPVFEDGVYKWAPGGEEVGPAELHEMGLCNEETCDFCEDE